jgi:hypothetical protein
MHEIRVYLVSLNDRTTSKIQSYAQYPPTAPPTSREAQLQGTLPQRPSLPEPFLSSIHDQRLA